MKFSTLCFVVLVLVLVLSLTGCGEKSTPSAEPTAITYTYPPPMYDPDEVAASLTAVPNEEAVALTEDVKKPEPTEVVASEPQVDNCVDCHTDQQALIDTADPVEEVVSENEGEG